MSIYQGLKRINVRTAERYIQRFSGIPSHINRHLQILYDENYYAIAEIEKCKPEDMDHLLKVMNNKWNQQVKAERALQIQ